MSTPLKIKLAGKSPTKRSSNLGEKKCTSTNSLNLDLLTVNKPFDDVIQVIKQLPNYKNNFPKVKRYISEFQYIQFASVFQFTLYNLCSQLLFIEFWSNPKFKSYTFVWIIDNGSFEEHADEFNAMRLDINVDDKDIICEIGQISTVDFPIDRLTMNKRTYTQSAVPILLALHLVTALHIPEVKLTDAAHKKVTCSEEYKETVRILDERLMMCNNSIYAKYGFTPEFGVVPHLLCKLTIRDIISAYKIRVQNPDLVLQQLPASLISTSHERKEFKDVMNKASTLIQQLEELKNKDMTLKDWLSLYTDEARNCRVILLKSLTSDYLNADFQYNDVMYGRGIFLELYRTEKDPFLVNTDVPITLKRIYDNGFS